jgi:uncharacterized protein (DUF58 family)
MAASFLSSIAIPPQWEAALKRRLNFHRLLWALTAVSFFIAWNRGLALLYGLFSLLAALLLISYWMPHRQMRHILVTRRCQADFTAGQPGSITYRATAAGARYQVELIDSLEFAEHPQQHFFFNKISGQTACTLRFRCLHRGCFRLGEPRLASGYPFGIVEFSRRVGAEPLEVTVFPRVVALTRLPEPLTADATAWGDQRRPQKGGRDEFTGVREYSRGDEMNRIHWPVSARHQKLMVREFEKTDRPAVLIVLDCNRNFDVGHAPVTTFEFAVTIAASMIRSASREGIPCFLATRTDRWQEMTVPAHSTDLFALYELLAKLKCDSRHAYASLIAEAHRRFPQAGLLVTFRLDPGPAAPQTGPRATHVDIELDARSFGSPEEPGAKRRPLRQANRWTYRVCADSSLEGLFL